MKGFRGYMVKTLNGMALGLFSSLIIGLILKQVGTLLGITYLEAFGKAAQYLMGPAIGVGVAHAIGTPPLGLFSCLVVGAIGAGTVSPEGVLRIGEPLGAFVAALIAAEFSKLISGKTKVDIIMVPGLTIALGGFIGLFLSPYIAQFMNAVGAVINRATELHPIPMGIVVSVIMGIILTLPISSAAIAISLGLTGLAGGASLVGCCCQMVGFAVISYKENGVGGLIAQGVGTSMLQIPNIIKNPRIWIAPILSSAVVGPLATTILGIHCNKIGAGMGTSGFVGQFGAYAEMSQMMGAPEFFIRIGIACFVLPIFLTLFFHTVVLKMGWAKSSDLKLSL
ncbi:MAG: PTS sugar transporter subunit IIC [Bacillota bacterium]|nr:PTS sugar transporter subunit IIC [Bacillota bacterium]